MIFATVQVDPSDIEIEDLQIWTEREPVEFWGALSTDTQRYVDWDQLLWNGEPIELEGESLEQFKIFVLETYQ